MLTHSFVARPAVDRFQNDFEQLFADLFRPHRARPLAAMFGSTACRQSESLPAMNVWEDEASYFVEAEVPGLRAEDLEIVVVGGEVTISGSRKDPLADTKQLHRKERSTGQFKRVVKLETQLNPGAVEASLKDGILTITLPKAEETKPRKIVIRPEAR